MAQEIYATVEGANVTTALVSGSLKLPPSAFELEFGSGEYNLLPQSDPAHDTNRYLNSLGFAVQTTITPFNPKRNALSPPAPIYDQNQWTWNIRLAPQTNTYDVHEIGWWVIDPNVNAGTRTLMAVSSISPGPLFTVKASTNSILYPIRGAIAGLMAAAITLEDIATYPVASATFPGNVYLGTATLLAALFSGTAPTGTDRDRTVTLGILSDHVSSILNVAATSSMLGNVQLATTTEGLNTIKGTQPANTIVNNTVTLGVLHAIRNLINSELTTKNYQWSRIKISGDGTGAKARVRGVDSNGNPNDFEIVGGSGYTSATATIDAGIGTGAVLTVSVSNNAVSGITSTGGTGYSEARPFTAPTGITEINEYIKSDY